MGFWNLPWNRPWSTGWSRCQSYDGLKGLVVVTDVTDQPHRNNLSSFEIVERRLTHNLESVKWVTTSTFCLSTFSEELSFVHQHKSTDCTSDKALWLCQSHVNRLLYRVVDVPLHIKARNVPLDHFLSVETSSDNNNTCQCIDNLGGVCCCVLETKCCTIPINESKIPSDTMDGVFPDASFCFLIFLMCAVLCRVYSWWCH